MEVYLYQLYALLRADKYNVVLLSGKVGIELEVDNQCVLLCLCLLLCLQGLLEKLLDAFAPLFSSESERCVSESIYWTV